MRGAVCHHRSGGGEIYAPAPGQNAQGNGTSRTTRGPTMVETRMWLSAGTHRPHPRVVSDSRAGAGERPSTSMATSAVALSDMRAAMTVLEKNRAHSSGAVSQERRLQNWSRDITTGAAAQEECSHTRSSRNPGDLCSIPLVISIPFSLLC
jgi:hypothetical protein